MPLNRLANLPDPDGFYEALVDAQRDLDDDAAIGLLARFALVLANHVGDPEVLRQALQVAVTSAH